MVINSEMDEEEILPKLIALSEKRLKSDKENKVLEDFVESLDTSLLLSLVSRKITSADGPQIIATIFLGLTMTKTCEKKRIKLIELLLSNFHEKDIPLRNTSSILTRLVIEVDKLPVTQLVRLCDLCVEYVLKSQNSQQTSWKDLLPKILSVLVTKDEIDHYGNEMTSENYKNQIVNALCQANWSPGILTSIASMFVHIPLNKEQHQKVITKFCSHLPDLPPEEVPPFIYQLLNLTKDSGAISVFFALKKYYNKSIYHLNESSSMLDSDKEILKSDENSEIGVSIKEVVESQRMVLYHIEHVAIRSLHSATELVKLAKSCIPCSEILFDPFFLALLLNVSSTAKFETQVMEILKNMITRLVIQDNKKNDSHWLRTMLNTSCDIELVLTKLIRGGACELENILRGLVSLSMNLLRAGSKSDKESKTISYFGRMIAVNIAIKYSMVAETLLESIVINIMNTPQVTQYTDCLGELCDNVPLLVIDNIHILHRLLDVLPSLPEGAASRVVYSTISLLRVSSKLRDNLIIILRKSLFLHDIGARKVAVLGFLQLLKRLKIKEMHTLSQNSFQAYTCPSVFTQTVIDVHSQSLVSSSGNNEGLCLDIISILKKCFMQQLPIKVCLYSSLHSAVKKNPELCIPVTDMFLEHLGNYFKPAEDQFPPLDFDKAITIDGNSVVITESLGHLLFIVQQIIITSNQLMTPIVDDEDYQIKKLKLCKIMDSLVHRFSNFDLRQFGLEDESSGPLDSKLKEEKLHHCIMVYQALIAYILAKWDITCTSNDVKTLMALFRAFGFFEDFAKNNKISRKDDATQKTKSKNISVQRKNVIFSETVLDFPTAQRVLSLILSADVEWCAQEVAVELKSKRSFYRFAMKASLEVIYKAKKKLAVHKSTKTFGDLTDLSKLIFENVISKFDEAMNFDPVSSILGLEIFSESSSLVFSHYRRQMTKFLSKVGGSSVEDGLDKLIEKIIKPYLKMLSKALDCTEDEAGDANTKWLVTVLVNGLNLFATELPVIGMCINKVFWWLSDLAQTKTLNSLTNLKTLISLLLTLLAKCKSEATLQDNLALQLCKLFGTINDEEIESGPISLAMVDDSSKLIVFQLLCQSLNKRLDAIDWVIVRVKAEMTLLYEPDAMQTNPQSRRAILKNKEKELVTELGLVVSASIWLTSSSIPHSCAEITCRLLHRIYACLTSFTKYFLLKDPLAYQEARFSKLVKLAASNLSTQVAGFLLYIETIDSEEEKKSHHSVKALRHAQKQTVYIPKLVAELENFTKCVTQLSIKSKDPCLVANLKLTTTRDFRLNTKRLEEVMRNREEEDDQHTSTSRLTQDTSTREETSEGQSEIDREPSTSQAKAPSQTNKKRTNISNSKNKKKKRKT